MVGPTCYPITDAKGVLLPTTDKDVLESQESYELFRNGDKPKTKNGPKSRLEILEANPKYAPPTVDEDGFYIDRDLWYFLLVNALDQEPLLLIGETGTGKTELAQYATKKLGIGLDIFDMAISNPVMALCGSKDINPQGFTEFTLARFAKSLQTPGVKLLDEISRAAPSANNVLLPTMDNRRTLYVEGNTSMPEIKMHEKAYFWATANLGIQYVGTQELDSALMNRFTAVEVTAPPKDMMVQVLEKRVKMDPKLADILMLFVEKVNNAENLSRGISPRQTLKVGKLVHAGYNLTTAITRIVLPQYAGDSIDGGERAVVSTLLQSL